MSGIRILLGFPTMHSALMRIAVLILSILIFDLSSRVAVLLYVYEAWICISLRLALRVEAIPGEIVSGGRIALRAMVAALVSAPVLTFPGLLVCASLFPEATFRELVAEIGAERGLVASAIGVLAIEIVDAIRIRRRLHAGIGELPNAFFVLARAWALVLPAMAMAEFRLGAAIESGLMLLAMGACILLFEGLPPSRLRQLGRALDAADRTREY